jgi:transposase InsO family protein
MCRVLGVSRAGFYASERRAPSDRDLADAWLTEKIREIHAESKGTYGARRVHADLRLAHDVRVGRKRVERLMALPVNSCIHPAGLPIHTSIIKVLRGPVESSQYTAVLFTGRCEKAGITPSTGSKGDCFDNAVSESFHASLKKELIYRHTWPTRAEARTAVFEYIEGWFNPRRRHSTLGYLSPADYEHQHEHQPLTTPQTPAPCAPTIA